MDEEIKKDLDEQLEKGEITKEEYNEELGKETEPSDEETEDKKTKDDEPTEEEPSKSKDDSKKDDPKIDEKDKDKVDDEPVEVKREPMIPLSKHRKARQTIKKLREDLATATSGPKKDTEEKETAVANLDEILKEYPDIDSKALGKIASAIEKSVLEKVKLPDDVLKDIAKMKELTAKNEMETGFDNEVRLNINPLLETRYPKATDDQKKKVIDILHNLAYKKENATTPLKSLFGGELLDESSQLFLVLKQGKKSAESSRGGAGRSKGEKILDLDSETEDLDSEMSDLSDKEFDKAHKARLKRSPSRLTVKDREGNIVN